MRSWGALGLALPAVLFCPLASFAGTAPGAPGARPTWTSGNKQGLGTAASPRSHVWFTLGDGALQEVYYPTVDTAETRLLELVVLDGGRLEEETADTEHHVHLLDPHALAFEQVNTAKTGRYRIRKVTLTDPERDTVLVHARFEPLGDGPFRVFVLFDPAIANSGLHDSGEARKDALLASKRQISAALSASPPFSQTHIGYRDSSDGMGSLRSSGTLPGYTRAPDGNVAGMAEVTLGGPGEFTLALGFGPGPASALESAEASLKEPFDAVLAAYTAGWTAYLAPLRKGPEPFGTAVAEAAMILKAHEDKTHPGAFVASLTIPWGDSADASKGGVGGYHLVWSRDLYHVATALLALGDRASAERALDYLFTVQQRPDGSFPQNTWLDGRPFWSSLQLDEVADPLILALDLNRTDPKTFKAHIRPAAEFILRTGPKTPQERWEEQGGYSPATIAAEIAGLISAAAIADLNSDPSSATRWRETADSWARALEGWTVTRTGPLDPGPYFLRIAQDGHPDAGRPLALKNGAGTFDERSIVDAGFLELVRLGIRPASDPLVARSLLVVDRTLRVETPRGPGFYRYNHDGYGEKPNGTGYDGTGVGRLWPLLTGERGEYALALGSDARPYLKALLAFGNEGGLLPEQVWDRPESPLPHLRFGEGTGSATPLAWSCAELVRLALGIESGRVLGMPEAVRTHFETPPR